MRTSPPKNDDARASVEVIATEAQLRALIGLPSQRAATKAIAELDTHCVLLIARSPFVLVASSDRCGRSDVSPRGGPSGFVRVLDSRSLSIPELPGNRRADTLSNVLQVPYVGLLFLIPGRRETLRVNGRASIVRDPSGRGVVDPGSRTAELALVVSVEEAFVHCGKCIIRSGLWNEASWPDLEGLPTHARCLVDHARLDESLDTVDRDIQQSYQGLMR